jgi:hypothetical protein
LIYIVTLDRQPVRPVPGFVKALNALAEYVQSVMPGVWLVDTGRSRNTADDIFEAVRPHMLKSDSVLVIRVKDDFNGWLKAEAMDWLQTSSSNGDF